MSVVLVAVGGLIGVLARYGLGTTVSPGSQPWLVLAINLVGSFVLGAIVPLSTHMSEPVRAGLAVGFCGGFTTFSTVTVQIFLDAKGGETSLAVLYLAASVAGGVLAAGLGFYAGRAIAS